MTSAAALLALVLNLPWMLLTSLGGTWVLANDVLNNPEVADLVTPWLVAYPLALLVRVRSAAGFAHKCDLRM